MSNPRNPRPRLNSFEVVERPDSDVSSSEPPGYWNAQAPLGWLVWTVAEVNARLAAHHEDHLRAEEASKRRNRAVWMLATILLSVLSTLATCCIAGEKLGWISTDISTTSSSTFITPIRPQVVKKDALPNVRRMVIAQAGDTVCGIASQHGVDANAIIDLNQLELEARDGLIVAKLYEGHRLELPASGERGAKYVNCF